MNLHSKPWFNDDLIIGKITRPDIVQYHLELKFK